MSVNVLKILQSQCALDMLEDVCFAFDDVLSLLIGYIVEDALEDDEEADCQDQHHLEDELLLIAGEDLAGLALNAGEEALVAVEIRRFLLVHFNLIGTISITINEYSDGEPL